ncbi:MAG: c-type cytochrome, partial [Solirubrobacteraceae bacterium]|nr:c-type cytochrome [Solirubrobacteraceae bacterium]
MIEQRRNLRWRGALSLALAAGVVVAFAGCTNDSGSVDSANLVNGKQLFVQKCGACHVMARAGSKGVSGPNLDEAFSSARQENWGDEGIRGVVYGQIL